MPSAIFVVIVYAEDCMPIYSKKGDQGRTSLFGSDRHYKYEKVFDVLGAIDELNASLGCFHTLRIPIIKKILFGVQKDLFELGSLVANKESSQGNFKVFSKKTKNIEDKIDKLDSQLVPLRNFIIPGGSQYAAKMHISRAMCRRLEREYALYYKKGNKVNEVPLKYLNRLSDLLFVCARYINKSVGVVDKIWKP